MITKAEIEERLAKCNKILQETHAMIDVLLEQKNAYSEDRKTVEAVDADLSSETIVLSKVSIEPVAEPTEPIK